MPPPPSTRERILDALEDLLVEHGERAATLDAVAQRAGVSKGGLLYHFGSKEALIDGLILRFNNLVESDIARMRAAPAGPLDYFIRTSVATEGPFDRCIVAAARLAQGAHPGARDALQSAQAAWLEVITETVHDPNIARTIMLLGDGLYYNSSLGAGAISGREMDDLLATVHRLSGLSP
jgi:AcrR family transcriptional regulator